MLTLPVPHRGDYVRISKRAALKLGARVSELHRVDHVESVLDGEEQHGLRTVFTLCRLGTKEQALVDMKEVVMPEPKPRYTLEEIKRTMAAVEVQLAKAPTPIGGRVVLRWRPSTRDVALTEIDKDAKPTYEAMGSLESMWDEFAARGVL